MGVGARGERTWSRAGGQGAVERGFMIRHESILFIFSTTLPTRRGTDGERERAEEKKTNKEKINSSRFVFHERAEPRSMRSPVPAPWCMMSPSHPIHPPLDLWRSKHPHHSTWLTLRLVICVNASSRRCSDGTGTSGGRDKSRQDRMWKEAER